MKRQVSKAAMVSVSKVVPSPVKDLHQLEYSTLEFLTQQPEKLSNSAFVFFPSPLQKNCSLSTFNRISQHRYSGAFCSGGDFALTSFMSKAAVRSNLTVFASDVQVVIDTGFPYVLGETNSIACHGAPGVSNTAGAALWVIDYTLQAAVQRMVETFFHEGSCFFHHSRE